MRTRLAVVSDIPFETRASISSLYKKRYPEAKILLYGIFPREGDPAHPLRLLIARTNKIISTYADNKNVFYEDIGFYMLSPSGYLQRSMMQDLLHPGEEGYQIWSDSIMKYVKKFVKWEEPGIPESRKLSCGSDFPALCHSIPGIHYSRNCRPRFAPYCLPPSNLPVLSAPLFFQDFTPENTFSVIILNIFYNPDFYFLKRELFLWWGLGFSFFKVVQ